MNEQDMLLTANGGRREERRYHNGHGPPRSLEATHGRSSVSTSRSRRRRRWISTGFTNRLLLLTMIWQILNVGILTMVDRSISNEEIVKHPLSSRAYAAGIAVMIFFQAVHLAVLILVSVKLAKQVLHHTASNSFLVQSYLSTVLLYTGVYTLVYRMDVSAFYGVQQNLGNVESKTYIVVSFIKLLYFSIATMTGTGFGDIYSTAWYMDLIVGSQMLVSVVYSTTIFAKSITFLGDWEHVPPYHSVNTAPSSISETSDV